ncbi:MAG: hypothetical protein GY862_17890 [Gammaproteobacteria bacterium]|nr:hypothetical protein [Gammaproteobacteria bacterium]
MTNSRQERMPETAVCKAVDIGGYTAESLEEEAELEAEREYNDLLFRHRDICIYPIDPAWKKAWKEDWKKGWEQGIEEGREKSIRDIAKAMLAKNMEAVLIIELTRLSSAELEALKNAQ